MDRIDRYKIVSVVEGSEGDFLYRAFDEVHHRTVAIKLFRTDNQLQRNQILSRLNEISASVGFWHPTLVTGFDWGESNGVVYVVADLFDGKLLGDLMADPAGTDTVDKLSWMMQSARALQYVHSKGITHGRLNPANILVMPNGQIKIMLLGISGQVAGGAKGLGALILTLAYQAPEQFEDVPIPLSDIFAFGVVFFHLLTGEHPFRQSRNNNLGMLVKNILRGIQPEVKMIGCPPALEKLVRRTMQKAPKDRYQAFGEIEADLAPILSQLESEWTDTRLNECEFLLGQGKIEETRQILQRILLRTPSNPSAISLRQRIRRNSQDREIGERCEKLLQTGKQAFERQDYAQAIKALDAAIAVDSLAIEASILKEAAILIQERLERVHFILEDSLQAARSKDFVKAVRTADLFLNETLEVLPHTQISHECAIKIHELIEAISAIGTD